MILNLKIGDKTITTKKIEDAGIEAIVKAAVSEEIADTQRDVTVNPETANPAEILCANCGTSKRYRNDVLLCFVCEVEQKSESVKQPEIKSPAVSESVMKELRLESVRQIQFAPVSVRYSGKEIDEIIIATMPALPEETKLELKKIAAVNWRADVEQNEPTIMDLEARVEYLRNALAIGESLLKREKDKLMIKLKPEIKRQEAIRKEKEKEKKIQTSLPKEIKFVHAANVLIAAHADLVAPVDKAQQAHLKRFLDHVSLTAQVDGEITTEWLKSQLQKANYTPLRPYFKFKK